MKTLKLTSPYMRGPDVTVMQTAIKSHGWLKGDVDGIYGPLSAQSAYRSKYWLGYGKLDQNAGDVLLGYLTGKKKPTDAMVKRAAQRKKEALTVPLRKKALDEAGKWIGQTENPPMSNRCKFSEWYGLIGPWCAMFVTYCYVEAGSLAFRRTQRYAYVPYILNDAQAGANNLTLTNQPQEGDLVVYDWQGDGVTDHTGLFVAWKDGQHTEFRTIEGNTGVWNDSNGGEVMRRERRKDKTVRAFVHVSK